MLRFPMALTGLLLAVSLAACSGIEVKRGEQARYNRDVPLGPGLLTGPTGEFVILRVDEEAVPEEALPAEQGASSSSPAEEDGPQ